MLFHPTRVATVLLATALMGAVPALGFDVTKMTDAERTAFGTEVRAYLLAHPEVLIEVSDALKAQQEAKQAANDQTLVGQNAAALFNDGYSYVGGNPDGDITLVEFLDYRCGYCRKAHDGVTNLLKSDGNIRYIVKEFPILGEDSVVASRFAISALRVAGPEAYQKISAGFYESFRGEVTTDTLAAFATGLGLDPAPILAGMSDPEIDKVIASNHMLAAGMDIGGTPTFVLGNKLVRGYVPEAALEAMLADERAAPAQN